MKTLFLFVTIAVFFFVAATSPSPVRAIVIDPQSQYAKLSVVTTTSYQLMIDVAMSSDSTYIESEGGSLTALTQYVFTGVYVQLEANGPVFFYPHYNAVPTLIGTTYMKGKIIGLYCPMIPTKIVTY